MALRDIRGGYFVAQTNQTVRPKDQRPTQSPSRTTWSDPYCERLSVEHLAILSERDAVDDQYFSGLISVFEYQALYDRLTAEMDAVWEQLIEEKKKEAPSLVQIAIDWGYTQEEAEKKQHDLRDQGIFSYNSSMNNFLYRRDVRGH
ncbi:hypothetical protein DENSPDRAFT_843742 [Dentipellis sp. KUC8613]|nr:hypothetical protein DENSPDRAFT_843742 [Dentipellis sp. KUC8613]